MRAIVLFSLLLFSGLTLTKADEKLSFSGLKEGEAIVIGYASSGCFHYVERKYVVRGGERATIEIFERKTRGRDESYEGPEHSIGAGLLLRSEVLGLDSFLFYLRSPRPDGCTTQDVVSFGYYRSNVKIGEEVFTDGSCGLGGIFWSEGKLRVESFGRFPAVSESIFRRIRPPRVIEMRICYPDSEAVAGPKK